MVLGLRPRGNLVAGKVGEEWREEWDDMARKYGWKEKGRGGWRSTIYGR
jgi:hypothetical protein